MPLNAVGWTTEEDEKLIELVEPHPYLYNAHSSRTSILTRESTWQGIAQQLSKEVEECKKRWRGLRDGYARSKRVGSMHKTKVGIFEKLKFLEESEDNSGMDKIKEESNNDSSINTEQQVITDKQEYYEITIVDGPQDPLKPCIKIIPKLDEEPPKKIGKKNCGRKKAIPVPEKIPPVKILPKPVLVNGPKIVQYIEDPKQPEQRSQTIDKLIEKILKENTNEIDVFFRSMAASVKKLQPNLIPKVKMEVCNVIAKYEMQSFDKNLNF